MARFGRLEDGVQIKQFAPGRLVIERPEAAAELDEECGAEDVVFEDERLERTDAPAAGVAVLHAMRERAGVAAIADVFPVLFGNIVRVFRRRAVLQAVAEARKRVLGPQLDAGHLVCFDTQLAHDASFPYAAQKFGQGPKDCEEARPFAPG